jgi:hypothetical protein
MRDRAKELLPSMLLTLMSIIQALALEFLWDVVRTADRALSWSTAFLWTQIVANMLGILQVWLFYTSVAMRFRWVPTFSDLTLPFLIGILEFTLIDLTDSVHLPLWFVALAAVYAVASWDAQQVMVRARRDADNREFFQHLQPAQPRDLAAPVVVVASLAAFGGAIYWSDGNRGLTMAGLSFATGSLLYQLIMSRYFWSRFMQAG